MSLQLIYVSSARGRLSSTHISEILDSSRRNNQRDGITGLLVFDDGLFFQVLEGEDAVVRDCFSRIATDPRHGSIAPIMENQIETRSFPDWSMGFKRPEELGESGQTAVHSLVQLQDNLGTQIGNDPAIAELTRTILGITARSHA